MAICNLDLPTQVTGLSLGSPEQLAGELAITVANALRDAIDTRGSAVLVVSGGRSPVAFFECLSGQALDWSKVTVSLADERFVPVSHPDSNEGLVRRHLLRGAAAGAQFLGLYHSAPGLDESAHMADAALGELGAIDVLVLGMGEDGHTASLFPSSPNLELALSADCPQRCLPMLAPSVPRQRLTLTLPLLASAHLTLLAVQGQAKLATLADALAGEDATAMPIRAFLRRPLEIHWCP
ncbi:6-phosphogluconolactonase [Pseudomonas sp. TCU-HL1]|uniref:6-phosphogluconolactonase n=1 Tax=Pseudomonas sp. TCU-HL1 TaxID=1856685 RepID=UPI00083D1008|nr:6-phosphogluconolactonase [Pseudomonas sp. TCU-HL1]AOE84079.1 6-phosphogluconolactonase [Pseudomonas sp. TCU-HL1]